MTNFSPDEAEPAAGGQTDKRRADAVRGFGGQAAVYLAATIVNSAIPFLLLPFLTRWLGPADFGVVGVFMASVSVLGAVIGLSTHGLIGVAYHRHGPAALPPQAGAAVGIASLMSVTLLAATWFARGWLAAETGVSEQWLWAIVAASAGQFVITVGLSVFQVLRQPYRYAAMQIGYGLTLGVLTVAFVGFVGMNWQGRVLAQTLAALGIATICLAWLTGSGGMDWAARRWPMRASLAFGLPLIPHALAGLAMVGIDRLVLGSEVGPVVVGQYFFAAQIGWLLMVVAAAINQAWTPWLYERLASNNPEDKVVVVRATYWLFLVFLTGGVALALLAPVIVPLVAGPSFDPAIGLLRIAGPAFSFMSMYYFVAGFLFFEKRTALLSAITVSAAMLQLVLSVVLVRTAGATGVAWAAFVSYAFYSLSTWFWANRVHPLPWLHFLQRQAS